MILNRPSSVQYQHLAATFTAAETTGRTAIAIEFPDGSGATNINQAPRPIMYRLTAVHGIGASASTIALAGGIMTVTATGYTAASEQRAVLAF